MKKLSILLVVIALTALLATPGAYAAMVMKGKKPAAPAEGQAATPAAPAAAPAAASAAPPAKTEAAPAKAEAAPAKEEAAPAKAEPAPVKEEKPKTAAKSRPKGEGVVGSIGYTQGDRALVDCRSELPAKTMLNVYDEGYRRVGLLRVVGPKGKNMYLTDVVDGSASTGYKVSVENEEEAYRRVSASRDEAAVKEFLEAYPDSAHAGEFKPAAEQTK